MDMLRDNPAIGDVGHIAPDQALRGLQQDAGLGDALGALDENPLPHVLVVSPRLDLANDQLHGLVRELESLSGVELAQLDLEWLERLNAMLELGQRGVLALAGLLSLAVLLTIGNTIRLAIENRREEIEITKLVGASNAFVRRPFLYTGFWFGSLGGVVGWLILYGVFTFMEAPLARLLQLYGSGLQFHAMTLQTTAVYLTISMLLGLSGAWLAVGRHLRTIEPA
jgi:cell division transport system permease protein